MVPILPENGRGQRSKLSAVILGIIFGSILFPGILGWWLFRRDRRRRPGPDILTALEIELVDAARGTQKNIALCRHEFCEACGGSGWRKDCFPPACDDCKGRGDVVTFRRFLPVITTCPTCAGEAPPITDPCPTCRGAGHIAHQVNLLIDVPPGVESGMWLQLPNQGELGDRGAPRGNLKIQLAIKKHPIFDRRHNDLYCKLVVSEAALTAGDTVQVPTLGKSRPLVIPRGTIEGDMLRMKGLGMPDIGGGFWGDLVVEIVLERVEE